MNSYQTANAAFAAAGLRPSEGVKHGRGYFFRRSRAFNKSVMLSVNYGAMAPGVLARVARDLQLDYSETKMSNGRAVGGIAAAKAGGTSATRFVVVHKPEGDGDEFDGQPWKVYDRRKNPQLVGIRGRVSFSFSRDAYRHAYSENVRVAA